MHLNSIKTADISFNRVTEFYLQELRNGNAPSIDVFVKAFPHLANEIKTELPAIVMLEKTVGANKKPSSKPVIPNLQVAGCVIEKELGRGAMGVVYRAFQEEQKRTVAVKVVNVQGTDSSIIAQRFDLERHAMNRLNHPNIVPVYSSGHNGQSAYLIMKCIDGFSLLDLKNGAGDFRVQAMFSELQSTWSLISRLGADVASGLQHSHEQGLVHRDIKPANLLMDKDGKVWITDYGLAKVYDYARSLSGTGDAIGTPRYMAPEQLRGVSDPRSDVYSLGITLYELVTDEKPWDDASLKSIIAKRTSLDLVDIRTKVPDIPEHLAKIIMKACALSPDDRYQTAKELSIVLERFQAGITPSDRRSRRREPDDVFRLRSRRNLSIATACSVGMFVASLAYLNDSPRSDFSQPAISPDSTASSSKSRVNRYQNSQSATLADSTVTLAPKLATANLLEKLADAKENEVGGAVREFFRQSVNEAGEQFHLVEQEKTAILNHWDDASQKITHAKTNEQAMLQFAKSYKSTTLPLGTKIASTIKLVERSSMTLAEKNAAYELLRNFAKATIHRSIPEDEAAALLLRLTGGKAMTTAELQTVAIPEKALRNWLGVVQQRVSKVPFETLNNLNLQTELDDAIRQSSDTPQK